MPQKLDERVVLLVELGPKPRFGRMIAEQVPFAAVNSAQGFHFQHRVQFLDRSLRETRVRIDHVLRAVQRRILVAHRPQSRARLPAVRQNGRAGRDVLLDDGHDRGEIAPSDQKEPLLLPEVQTHKPRAVRSRSVRPGVRAPSVIAAGWAGFRCE